MRQATVGPRQSDDDRNDHVRAWTSIGRNATANNADFTTYAYCMRS
jgi:hypothetical protein